jgi:hypothetical protein
MIMKFILSSSIRLLLLIGLAATLITCADRQQLAVPSEIYVNKSVSSPADIVQFNGKYVVSELYNNRLAILDDPTDQTPEYFDPATIGKRFSSPHYLAVTPENTLLISNGWGNSIVEINDLNGAGWKEFRGVETEFWAPHGICISKDGKIYVGDSLNSRLVRFDNMDGNGWQVFSDTDSKVAYGRQLHCEQNRIWISNSYESNKDLNPGNGGNVLVLKDFDSGKLASVFELPDANFTAVMPLDNKLLLGLWGSYSQVATVTQTTEPQIQLWGLDPTLGTPYSLQAFGSENQYKYGAAMIGKLDPQPEERTGGIVFFNF